MAGRREATKREGSVEAAAPVPGAKAPEPVNGVLGLQRTLGNRLTTELLRQAWPGADEPGAIGAAGGQVDPRVETAIRSARNGGTPLPPSTRSAMEGAFGGADFSSVRVHADREASQLNRAMSADAFTVGSDIFFSGKVPDASSPEGRTLLAHELTHTIQQGASECPRRASVQRSIDKGKVDKDVSLLGIKSDVHAIEVPKKATPATKRLGDYPATNQYALTPALQNMALIELMYPDWQTAFGPDEKDYWNSAAANDIVDGLGGGAYNSAKDLVVLGEAFSDAALLHELGHKAQAESGASNDTALTIVLEYHNILTNQNMPWYFSQSEASSHLMGMASMKDRVVEEPRLFYDKSNATGSGKGRKKTLSDSEWAQFRTTVAAAFDHAHPRDNGGPQKTQTVKLLEEIAGVLEADQYQQSPATGPDKAMTFAQIIRKNLFNEYMASGGVR